MAIKYINIFPPKGLQNLPKLEFLVRKETIWQPWPPFFQVALCYVEAYQRERSAEDKKNAF
jgi:hypothetical protein